MTVKHYGRFSIKVENTETGEIRELPEQDNLVLNKAFSLGGFTERVQGGFYCLFGTGSTAPDITDTGLSNPLRTYLYTTPYVGRKAFFSGNDFFVEMNMQFTGVAGSVIGNISELGLSLTSNETGLFTRALIKDDYGTPTTISLGANDILTVNYTYGCTIDLTTSLITSKDITIGGVVTTVELHWADYDIDNDYDGFWYTDDRRSNMPANPIAYCEYLNPYQGVIEDFSDIASQATLLKASSTSSPNPSAGYADGTVSGVSMTNASFPAGSCTGTWNGILFYSSVACNVCCLTFDPPLVKGADDVFTIDSLILGVIRGV